MMNSVDMKRFEGCRMTLLSFTYPCHRMSLTRSESEFRRIQEEAEQQSARINALRSEISSLVTSKPQKPKEPVEVLSDSEKLRPLLISRVDNIQSRLAQLAAALSPSNKSTPMSHRGVSPLVRPQRPTVPCYPINTPPSLPIGREATSPSSVTSEDDKVLGDLCSGKLSEFLVEFERKIDASLHKLTAQKSEILRLTEELRRERESKEKEDLESLLNSITNIGSVEVEEYDAGDMKEFVQQELDTIRLDNADVLSQVVKEAGGEKFKQIQDELRRIESSLATRAESRTSFIHDLKRRIEHRVESELARIRSQANEELERVKTEFQQKLAGRESARSDEEIGRLRHENSDLKALVRKMKICLSKWRIDYLSELNGERRDDSPVVGEKFAQLSQTLSRMWNALGPSGTELVEFLQRLEGAIESKGQIPIASVYREECSRHVEKLPLAELAARREYLLAKRELSDEDKVELESVTSNLTSLILEYQDKHKQSFMYDGGDYLRTLHRVSFRS